MAREYEGNFTTADKKKMFLSHQIYTGILINVHSIIEMVSGMAQITIIVTMTMIIFKNLYRFLIDWLLIIIFSQWKYINYNYFKNIQKPNNTITYSTSHKNKGTII